MKIIHIHHHYWPVVGGLENVVRALAEGMARLGHEVHVVTSIYGAQGRPREEVVNGVYIHRVRSIRLGYPDLTYPLEYPSVIKDADALLIYSHNSLFNYAVARRIKGTGNAVLTTYFTGVDYLRNHYNPVIRTLGYMYEVHITRKIVEMTDAALTTNVCEAELLRSRYGVGAHVIPHGIDGDFINRPYGGDAFRSKYGISNDFIAYLGRLHPTKGVDLLIKAFSIVKGEFENVSLVIAGSGPGHYVKYLRRLADRLEISRHVYFLGYISEEDKVGLIDASRFLVLPSKHAGESYPMVINEAAARAKPIVVSRMGCAWSIGLSNIVPAEPNAEGFAESMARLLDDRYYNRLLANIRNGARPLTWGEVTEMVLRLWA